MNRKSKVFVIVDFNAGQTTTHHLNYVTTYANFLQSAGVIVKLILPKYLPLNISELSLYDVRRVLKSRYYRLNRSRIGLNRIYYFVLRRFNVGESFFITFIEQKIEDYFIRRAYKHIIDVLNENINSILFFPSIDLMALRFLDYLFSRKKIESNVFLRLNALEHLIPNNSNTNILTRVLEGNKKIILGVETSKISSYLREAGIYSGQIFWAPLPYIKRYPKPTSEIIFGSLGGAKKRKGFDELPFWINNISQKMTNAKFLIQQSPYHWPGYQDTLKVLGELENVVLLPERLSNEDFFYYMSLCNFSIAPYNQESYNWGGSSIFYYASDFLIPTLTYKHLPFSNEIIQFKCGLFLDDISSRFKTTIFEDISRTELERGLISYNESRNKANKQFLAPTIDRSTCDSAAK